MRSARIGTALRAERPAGHHDGHKPFLDPREACMPARPHDITDLYLAPVALAVDARIEELGHLDQEQLAYEVALESDSPDFTREMRQEGLIRTVTHLIDTHDWKFSWDPRGLRLTHDAHTFVLGIPAVFVEYLQEDQTE